MQNSNLIIMNYAMDSEDPVFSHQVGVVRMLASRFNSIDVITNRINMSENLPLNVRVHTTEWKSGQNLRNIFRLVHVFSSMKKVKVGTPIFSHMTEVQSVFITPWAWWWRAPHFLWYAHTTKSIFLKFNSFFVKGIFTSTPGSCPLKGEKVHAIGQGIDKSIFLKMAKPFDSFRIPSGSIRGIHVGRIDKSKRIEEIIESTLVARSDIFKEMTFVGEPSAENVDYLEQLKRKYSFLLQAGKLHFVGRIKRKELPKFLQDSDLFIHAFQGSLDKSLLEATMAGIPVVTSNREYIQLFGSWGKIETYSNIALQEELEAFLKSEAVKIETRIAIRQKQVASDHSLESWVNRLVNLIEALSV
jgi:glycosyltransferase involved in cell wall biosynthesis